LREIRSEKRKRSIERGNIRRITSFEKVGTELELKGKMGIGRKIENGIKEIGLNEFVIDLRRVAA
jgi:hypothetical protein